MVWRSVCVLSLIALAGCRNAGHAGNSIWGRTTAPPPGTQTGPAVQNPFTPLSPNNVSPTTDGGVGGPVRTGRADTPTRSSGWRRHVSHGDDSSPPIARLVSRRRNADDEPESDSDGSAPAIDVPSDDAERTVALGTEDPQSADDESDGSTADAYDERDAGDDPHADEAADAVPTRRYAKRRTAR